MASNNDLETNDLDNGGMAALEVQDKEFVYDSQAEKQPRLQRLASCVMSPEKAVHLGQVERESPKFAWLQCFFAFAIFGCTFAACVYYFARMIEAYTEVHKPMMYSGRVFYTDKTEDEWELPMIKMMLVPNNKAVNYFGLIPDNEVASVPENEKYCWNDHYGGGVKCEYNGSGGEFEAKRWFPGFDSWLNQTGQDESISENYARDQQGMIDAAEFYVDWWLENGGTKYFEEADQWHPNAYDQDGRPKTRFPEVLRIEVKDKKGGQTFKCPSEYCNVGINGVNPMTDEIRAMMEADMEAMAEQQQYLLTDTGEYVPITEEIIDEYGLEMPEMPDMSGEMEMPHVLVLDIELNHEKIQECRGDGAEDDAHGMARRRIGGRRRQDSGASSDIPTEAPTPAPVEPRCWKTDERDGNCESGCYKFLWAPQAPRKDGKAWLPRQRGVTPTQVSILDLVGGYPSPDGTGDNEFYFITTRDYPENMMDWEEFAIEGEITPNTTYKIKWEPVEEYVDGVSELRMKAMAQEKTISTQATRIFEISIKAPRSVDMFETYIRFGISDFMAMMGGIASSMVMVFVGVDMALRCCFGTKHPGIIAYLRPWVSNKVEIETLKDENERMSVKRKTLA